MDAAAELGRNPVSKHQVQPECEDEQADAGRYCRTRLARPNSQARTTRTGKYLFSLSVRLTTSRIGNLTRLIHTLAMCVTIHTYIHTYTLLNHQKHYHIPGMQTPHRVNHRDLLRIIGANRRPDLRMTSYNRTLEIITGFESIETTLRTRRHFRGRGRSSELASGGYQSEPC